ncbi:MAG: acetyl-CoA carboxylase biotin carboxyl carrier protein [Acidobacteriota bacterium]|nr:acetyl-CoA carboxylase biotin carboxyl carrier protein [Acidobacteriota bacterium]
MAKKLKAVGPETEYSGVNLDEIERLLDFMQSHGLEELEFQRGDLHVRLKKTSSVRPVAAHPRVEQPAAVVSAAPAAESVSAMAAPQPPQREREDNLHTVKSPIVGTFYSAPSPEAQPFVTVGASVETGQVLCIIEAMKLMNEIESDLAGEVVRIHVENGKPVEYGAALFDIRPRS